MDMNETITRPAFVSTVYIGAVSCSECPLYLFG